MAFQLKEKFLVLAKLANIAYQTLLFVSESSAMDKKVTPQGSIYNFLFEGGGGGGELILKKFGATKLQGKILLGLLGGQENFEKMVFKIG